MKDHVIALVSEILSADSKLRELSANRNQLVRQLDEIDRAVVFQEETKRAKEAVLDGLLQGAARAATG